MSTYLEGYGAGEEKRARLLKWTLLGLAALVIGGGGLYFGFRNYGARSTFDAFLDALQRQDYAAAHAFWGCTEATPCRDYDRARFLRDWGPDSPAKNAASARLVRSATCGGIFTNTGVLRIYRFEPDYEVSLWVDKQDGRLGFAPVIGRMQCTVLP